MASVDIFWIAGNKITGHNSEGSVSLGYRKFRAFFGTSPMVCVVVWDMLIHRPNKLTPEHLLWGLLLLKQYNIESINATLVGVSEKTYRKWSHIVIQLLADLPVVRNSYGFFSSYFNLFCFSKKRLIGKIVSKTPQSAHPYWFLLMGRILGSWSRPSSILNGGPISLMVLVCDMK